MRSHWLVTASASLLVAGFACSSEDNPGGEGTSGTPTSAVTGSDTSSATTDASTTTTDTGTTTGSGGSASSAVTGSSTTTDGTTTTAASGGSTSSTTTDTTAATGGTSSTTTDGTTTGGGGTGGNPVVTGSYDCSPAEGEVPALTAEVVADGFENPTFVTVAPGDTTRLFVLEQPGVISVVENGSTSTFLDLQGEVYQEQFNNDERGLLALAFHPDYENNGLFYVHYSASGSGNTQVSEFSVSDDPNVADPASERTVLTENQLAFNHNGGMLAFGPDGFLHMGLGDGGDSNDTQNNGQNLDTIKGSLLRIDVDGRDAGQYSIPAGNMGGGAPEILDYGLRNPWRFSFDPCTGDIYIGDVGQDEWEEIDVRPAGTDNVNWGWSVKEGMGCCLACANGGNSCDESGLTDPIIEYSHGEGQSVTGGYVYRSSEIPGLRGYYFYADFSSQVVWMFRYDNGEAADHQEVSLPGSGGITSFGQDNSGNVYVVRYSGAIQKIVAQ